MWKRKNKSLKVSAGSMIAMAANEIENELESFCQFKEGDWVEIIGVGKEYFGLKCYVMDLDEDSKKVLIRAFHRNQTDISSILWIYPDYLKPSPLDECAKKELIDMALDLKDAVWFYDLVEGK